MKTENLVFTDFNISFVTFPRQVFVVIFHGIFVTKTISSNYVPIEEMQRLLILVVTMEKYHNEFGVIRVVIEEMPEALDNSSQPYSRAYGYGEMAGKETHPHGTLLICKGHTQKPCRLPKGRLLLLGQPYPSHCATPKGVSVWLATPI